ncbi:MAG: Cu(I)-responsive transcriptional regulator [Amylibacter sp.]|nr:Cu(I)-responsive transcriptional regulator [Amylibacter sp.]|tara:strand:- start:96 stop:482 length:387 start_codon:yes stop_codon:yes gene_type:complete
MNIGKAASLSGLSIKTVRYYSDIGIIEPDIHSDTGYRIFSNNDVAKLQFIGKARKFNFGIEECRELLALYENKDRPSKNVKKLTLEKIAEIDIKLSELKGLREQLGKLALACEGNERSQCPILDALSS